MKGQSSIINLSIIKQSVDGERKFDLDERTFQFALAIRKLVGSYRWTREQWTDVDQVLRSSGSVASNYAEANNPVSSADFSFRLKICRKESGESRLWIRLLASTSNDDRIPILRGLFKEADELTRIFNSILKKLGD